MKLIKRFLNWIYDNTHTEFIPVMAHDYPYSKHKKKV